MSDWVKVRKDWHLGHLKRWGGEEEKERTEEEEEEERGWQGTQRLGRENEVEEAAGAAAAVRPLK